MIDNQRDIMRDGFDMLVAAVAEAAGRKLDVKRFNDRLIMQKGCYILNSLGVGPIYDYGLYIRGPYSRELADDYYEIKDIPAETNVSADKIEALKCIFDKGIGYAEAYATVLLLKRNNVGADPERILDRALELKPNLDSEVREAYASLLS